MVDVQVICCERYRELMASRPRFPISCAPRHPLAVHGQSRDWKRPTCAISEPGLVGLKETLIRLAMENFACRTWLASAPFCPANPNSWVRGVWTFLLYVKIPYLILCTMYVNNRLR